jgi:DNA gyrase subunit A
MQVISQERYIEMSAAEQFILTISENGYGKRTSSFEYRVTGRGGKGIGDGREQAEWAA